LSQLADLVVCVPLAFFIENTVKEVKSMRVHSVTYRYSKMDDGTEFLQKWAK
jgi:hypothetical protein